MQCCYRCWPLHLTSCIFTTSQLVHSVIRYFTIIWAKMSLMSWVVVIPILLLVWHRIFFFFFFFFKVGVMPKEGWTRPCASILLLVWQWLRPISCFSFYRTCSQSSFVIMYLVLIIWVNGRHSPKIVMGQLYFYPASLHCYIYVVTLLRGFAPNKLLIHPTPRIQNKCACRLTLMNSL